VNKLKQEISQAYDNLLNFIFPPQCVICDSLHDNEHYFICKRCESSLDYYTSPLCLYCRFEMSTGEKRCQICEGRPVITRLFALGQFDDFYRPLVHALKYDGIIPAGRYLGRKLGENIKKLTDQEYFDLIIPIPLHKSRLEKRGFNQSELLSRYIAEKLDLRVDCENLMRIRKTRVQTGLTRDERLKNIQNAFVLNNPDLIKNKKIILVDDVTTTGSTALEAAELLRKTGAKEIILAVIAQAAPDSMI